MYRKHICCLGALLVSILALNNATVTHNINTETPFLMAHRQHIVYVNFTVQITNGLWLFCLILIFVFWRNYTTNYFMWCNFIFIINLFGPNNFSLSKIFYKVELNANIISSGFGKLKLYKYVYFAFISFSRKVTLMLCYTLTQW